MTPPHITTPQGKNNIQKNVLYTCLHLISCKNSRLSTNLRTSYFGNNSQTSIKCHRYEASQFFDPDRQELCWLPLLSHGASAGKNTEEEINIIRDKWKCKDASLPVSHKHQAQSCFVKAALGQPFFQVLRNFCFVSQPRSTTNSLRRSCRCMRQSFWTCRRTVSKLSGLPLQATLSRPPNQGQYVLPDSQYVTGAVPFGVLLIKFTES